MYITHMEVEKCLQSFRKPEWRVGNIKMDLWELCCECVNQIQLARYKVQCWKCDMNH